MTYELAKPTRPSVLWRGQPPRMRVYKDGRRGRLNLPAREHVEARGGRLQLYVDGGSVAIWPCADQREGSVKLGPRGHFWLCGRLNGAVSPPVTVPLEIVGDTGWMRGKIP